MSHSPFLLGYLILGIGTLSFIIVSYLPRGRIFVFNDISASIQSDDSLNIESSVKETPLNSKQIQEKIYHLNLAQQIYNANTFNDTLNLVILIQVHNRLIYLRELIKSLSKSTGIQQTLIIFSHDVYSKLINDEIQKINFCKVMQIFYPFSIQIYPNQFPGFDRDDCPANATLKWALKRKCKNAFYRDSFGNYRNHFLTQLRHHWWWKINHVFGKVTTLDNYFGLVLLLEEDQYLAPDFIHSLALMQEHSTLTCPNCVLFSLGISDYFDFTLYNEVIVSDRMHNFGLAFNRSTWNKIRNYSDHFCKYDDYNWDWSLQHILQEFVKPPPFSMVLAASRVYHIGICGTHHKNFLCNPTVAIEQYKSEQRKGKLYPQLLYTTEIFYSRSDDDDDPVKLNGGWGDPRDHALCMSM